MGVRADPPLESLRITERKVPPAGEPEKQGGLRAGEGCEEPTGPTGGTPSSPALLHMLQSLIQSLSPKTAYVTDLNFISILQLTLMNLPR